MTKAEAIADRDKWVRLFNRLDAAVAHHRKAKGAGFRDEADDALASAHDRILRAAAEGHALPDCGVCGVPATFMLDVCEGYAVPRCWAHADRAPYQAESRLATILDAL